MAIADVALPTEPTTLFYYLELKDGGIIQTYPGTAFEKRRKHVPHDVKIKDLRNIREDFTVDSAGFELVSFKSKVKDFANENEIKDVWYDEVKELMKKVSGASEVHIVSHMCRRHTYAEAQDDAKVKGDQEFVTRNNPARFVHVDQSYRGAEQIMFLNLPEEEAERRMKKRWAIMNVWAPIDKPVKKDPLAFCDFRSVDENDFRTVVANLPPPGAGEYGNTAAKYEVTNMAHNPNQEWFYASDMTPEEAWVFKIFDSKDDGRAKCAVHSSFPLKGQDDTSDPRTSIEVRCFVFWDDEEAD
ncbi:hypothetical protein P280DRAFT_427639, partial [Massarina eburnea CBS 473.64]